MSNEAKGHDWDTLVPQIVEELSKGRRLNTISKEIGVSAERIRQVLKKYGEKIPAQRPLPLGKRPSKAFLIARGQDIIKDRIQEGLSLEEIGIKHGITRERVRQILVEAGHETHTDQAKAGRGERTEKENEELHIVAVKMLTENPSLTRTELSESLNIRPENITRLLGSNIWMLSEEQIVNIAYTSSEMLINIRRAARDKEIYAISSRIYDHWRNEHTDENTPGSQTIVRRFGTWSEAVIQAGLEPIAAKRLNYQRISWEEATSAIAGFIVREHKTNPKAKATSADYEGCSAETPSIPSMAGIRLYWTWREVRVGAVKAILKELEDKKEAELKLKEEN
jgi:hypothetical protein